MRRACLVFAFVVIVGVANLRAQGVSYTEQLTVTSTAASLSVGTTALTFCRGTVETAAQRMTIDGSTPTASTGQPLNVGDQILLNNREDIRNFKVIAMTTASGVLNMRCGSGTPAGLSIVQPASISVGVPGSPAPPGGDVVAGRDATNRVRTILATPDGLLQVQPPYYGPGLPRPLCNPVASYNCQPKGF